MIERHSLTWLHVARYAEDEIALAHASLERPGLDAINTELHRGRIAALRDLLAQGEPPEPKPDASAEFTGY